MEVPCRIVRQLAGSMRHPRRSGGISTPSERVSAVVNPQQATAVHSQGDPTLGTFFEDWFIPVRLSDASPDTVTTYRVSVRLWAALTGDPPLKEVTPQMLAFFRDALLQRRGLKPASRTSPNTVRRIMRDVQIVLDKAGPPCPRNRDAAGKIPSPPWIKPLREVVRCVQTVGDEQLGWLYTAAIAMDVPRIPGVKPAAWRRSLLVAARCTGLRRRTLLQMGWEHMEWDHSRLHIPGTFFKNRRPQVIPLPPIAIEHLHSIRTDRERIFQWPARTWCPFHKYFHRLQDSVGIPRSEHFGLHRIRKTVASLIWAQSPEAAQLLCGHASGQTTMRHYVSSNAIVAKAVGLLSLPEAFSRTNEPT